MRKIVITLFAVMLCTVYAYADIDTYDYDELIALSGEAQNMMQAAHQMAEAARALGYPETHDVICLAGKEWTEWNAAKEQYDRRIRFINNAMDEYPVATIVWLELKQNGFTDEAAAGILGNMMVECGGQTLALNHRAYNSKGYYGLCQWSRKYYPQMYLAPLEEQVAFLLSSVMDGYKDMTDTKEAAIRFAMEYERCSSKSYQKRAKLAQKAFDYFKEEGQ